MIAATSYANQLDQLSTTPSPFASAAPRTRAPDGPGWQQLLADAVTDPWGAVHPARARPGTWSCPPWRPRKDFALRVPRSYVARMRKGDPNDPLLLQVLPIAAETHGGRGLRLPIRSATWIDAPPRDCSINTAGPGPARDHRRLRRALPDTAFADIFPMAKSRPCNRAGCRRHRAPARRPRPSAR